MFKFISSLINRNEDALKEQIVFLKSQIQSCKSCETYKQQLDFVNNEKAELMETLIQLTRPNIIVPTGETKELKQVPQAGMMFGRRRTLLENAHRLSEEKIKTSPFVASVSDLPRATVKDITPQSVDALEHELGLGAEDGAKENAS